MYQLPLGLRDILHSESLYKELITKLKENIHEELMSMISHNKILIATEIEDMELQIIKCKLNFTHFTIGKEHKGLKYLENS